MNAAVSGHAPARGHALLPLAVLLALTFWLPTRIAPPVANSDSYCFGFNNHAFQLLLGVTLAAAAFLAWTGRLSLPQPAEPWPAAAPVLSLRLLAACLCISAVLCGVMCWLTVPLGGIGDSVYYLDRIHLMLRGQVPVRDFEFIYGTGPLYLPVLVSRVLPVSADAAYFALWVAATLLGMFLLWLSIRWLDLPSFGKRGVFLAVYFLMTLLVFGATMNYCVLRYTLPLFALVGLARLDRLPGRRIAVLLFIALMSALLLAYSPEEGLVYATTACVYLPLRRRLLQRPFLPDLVALLVLCAGLLVFFARLGTFTTMQRLGAGAFHLPVYPGPHILLAIAALLLLILHLAARPNRASLPTNLTACTLYSIGMIPGAFGRCDTIHIAGYLLPAIICAMLLLHRWQRAWRPALLAFVLVFCIVPFSLGLWQQPPILSKAVLFHLYRGGEPQGFAGRHVEAAATRLAQRLLGAQRGAAKIAALRNSSSSPSVDPHVIFPQASAQLAVPFEYMPNKQSNYQAPWIDEGYFMGTLNVLTPEDLQRKLQELTSHPSEDLVVSIDGFDQCAERGGSAREMRSLLLLPWVPRPKHRVTLFVPYCRFLQEHYHFIVAPAPQTFGYGLMRLNALPASK